MVFTQTYFDLVNELLQAPGATALGAYAMGMVTVAADHAGLIPDRQLLYAASRVVTLHAVVVVYDSWVAGKQGATVRESRKAAP